MAIGRPEMILFDYGGTLLCEPDWDLLRGEKAVFEHVIRNPNHYTPEEVSAWERQFFQSLKGIRDAGAELTEIQMLRLKYEIHGIKLDISYEEAEWILWEHTAPMTEKCVYPNIQKVLEFLREQRIRTGVISNIGWTGAALARRIHTLLPENHFEFILASSDYGIRKPDARLFQVALAKAELAPEKIWFCGDTKDTDMEGARRVGMTPVYYQGRMSGDNKPADKPDIAGADCAVIGDWTELAEMIRDAGPGS